MCDRNSAIESYRMMLMFGICVLHALCIKDHRWAVYSLLFLVDAFVFITGYYGVTLTSRRLPSLSINVVYCLLVASIFNKVFYGEDILKTMLTIWSTMWFVHAYVLFFISFAFAPLGLARYNSPIAVIMDFASFTIFNSLRLPDWFSKRLIFIGPLLFSVYLLHSNETVGFRIIRAIIEWCNTGVTGCFVAAASVFVGCIILDIPRRVICSGIAMKCYKRA